MYHINGVIVTTNITITQMFIVAPHIPVLYISHIANEITTAVTRNPKV